MTGAALAWLGVGYGGTLAVTATAALLVSLFATSALIRMWAVLADEHGERRTVAMTEGEVSVSLGGIVAPLLIGGLAASQLGWRAAFAAGAVMTVGAVLAGAFTMLPAPPPRPAGPPSRVPGDWRAPTLLVVIAIVALEFALLFWLASYLTDDVGLSRRAAALMVSLLFGANLGGRLLASRLARRVSADRLLAGSIGLACVGMPALLAATGPAAAAAGLVVVGVGVGAMFPLTSSLHVGASPRDADGAIGQVLSAAAIGQIAGPLVVAGVAQASDLRAGLLALPVLAVLAAGGLAWHRRAAGRLADGARTS
jgi:predicted MFS family arabinose efflux permease